MTFRSAFSILRRAWTKLFLPHSILAQSRMNQEAVKDTSPASAIQIVVPIYNEGENVVRLCSELKDAGVQFDSLRFVYDFDGDITLPFIEKLHSDDARIVADKNCFGRGVINALRWGCAHASNGPVLIVMGDNSDKLSIIPEMVQLWKSGATIVSPSRYMRGGEQHGGGVLKSNMSRIAGTSLKIFGFPTADATNNFKLYDGEWLRSQSIESTGGFELAIELCAKAFEQGKKIVELPTVWRDRTMGESNFKLFAWTPKYLRWYLRILRALVQRSFSPVPNN